MIELVPLDAAFGVDIVGFDIKNPTDDEITVIQNAIHAHSVVRIRGQEFTDADQLRFTRHFGELSVPTLKQTYGKDQAGTPDNMTTVSNIVVDGEAIGQLGSEELDWHSDLNYKERPHAWSLLHAIELPDSGGDTHFINCKMAYEALSDDLKQRIDGIVTRHDIWALTIQIGANDHGTLAPGIDPPAGYGEGPWWETHDGIEHPLVRTHPATKGKALYFGRRHNLYIPGIPYAESEALLDTLYSHAIETPAFRWIQQWQLGDLIIWDNRSGMHRRDPFDQNARRLMRRTNTQGERPY
jgi:taurine dioxygenase